MPEAQSVRSMFGRIAGRYDLANRLLSGGIDIYWRWRLTGWVRRQSPRVVADLATGSGDVAFALRRRLGPDVEVRGYDFCPPMLEEAREKGQRDARYRDIPFAEGDCLELPIPDQSVDAVTISFGLRNLENRHQGLQEMHRILRPGGYLYCLEFSQPYTVLRPFYYLYLKYILPIWARLLTGDKAAYDYLAGSIESFPTRSEISAEFLAAGFTQAKAIALTGSIVALHRARK